MAPILDRVVRPARRSPKLSPTGTNGQLGPDFAGWPPQRAVRIGSAALFALAGVIVLVGALAGSG
jgi:hypothetical protein